MKLYNLKDDSEQVSFAQAVTQGLGKNQGLFFPHDLPEFSLTEIESDAEAGFCHPQCEDPLALIGDEIPQEILEERVRAAFAFPAPVADVESDVGCLELFHGPTLAFKDFGGRFMPQIVTHIAGDKPVTILTRPPVIPERQWFMSFLRFTDGKWLSSIHEAKSVHCKKNCSVHWAAISKLLPSTAISMPVRRW
ncbi:hypothetical protein ACLK2F_00020 [Escherichia coli]